MTFSFSTQKVTHSILSRVLACFFLFLMSVSYAGPGAHGPNGEHLDTPGGDQAHSHSESDKPRMETFSENFELVATLEHDELSILIDRYDTNEPVLSNKGSKVEVEVEVDAAAGIKASSQFHADHGDYSVTDPRLLNALSKPGKHALVFTVLTQDNSDLLEGTLTVAPQNSHSSPPSSSPWKSIAIASGIIGCIVFFVFAVMRFLNRRRSRTSEAALKNSTRNSL
ncbi:MAG: hypothetical protein V4525_08850 [Pseudomonadota bacterium]